MYTLFIKFVVFVLTLSTVFCGEVQIVDITRESTKGTKYFCVVFNKTPKYADSDLKEFLSVLNVLKGVFHKKMKYKTYTGIKLQGPNREPYIIPKTWAILKKEDWHDKALEEKYFWKTFQNPIEVYTKETYEK